MLSYHGDHLSLIRKQPSRTHFRKFSVKETWSTYPRANIQMWRTSSPVKSRQSFSTRARAEIGEIQKEKSL